MDVEADETRIPTALAAMGTCGSSQSPESIKLTEKIIPMRRVRDRPINKPGAGSRDLTRKQLTKTEIRDKNKRNLLSPGITAWPIRMLFANNAEACVSVDLPRMQKEDEREDSSLFLSSMTSLYFALKEAKARINEFLISIILAEFAGSAAIRSS